MDNFYREEYDTVNRLVDGCRVNRLSLPDQFLVAAVCDGRTGNAFADIKDEIVKNALELTGNGRVAVSDPQISDTMCNTIIQEQIWPVFRRLCEFDQESPAMSPAAGHTARGISRPVLTPRGSTPHVDTSVPSAHHPGGNLTGKAIKGAGTSLLDDDGLLVPGRKKRDRLTGFRP